jgi:hypothetical protein
MRPRHNRWLVLLALVALVYATTAFLAHTHEHDERGAEAIHCDLCLQFTKSAGAASAPAALAAHGGEAVHAAAPAARPRPERRVRAHPPSAPPFIA